MRRYLGVILLAVTTASAQQLTDLYKQVLHPPVVSAGTVGNVAIPWDALQFTLNSGQLAMTGAVAGRVTAAVFTGQGHFSVTLPNDIETQQVALFRGSGELAAGFTEAIFHFGDDSAFRQALGGRVNFAPVSGAAAKPFDDLLEERGKNIDDLGWPLAARILVAMAAPPGRLLMVELHLADGTWVEADDDPLQQQPIRVHARASNNLVAQRQIDNNVLNLLSSVGTTAGATGIGQNQFTLPPRVFDDTWTQFSPSGAITPAPWKLDAYDITVTVPGGLAPDMQAVASFAVAATGAAGAGAGLLLDLQSHLRVTGATLADGTPVGWVQPNDPGEFPAVDYEGGWVYLQLPKPLAPGQPATVKLSYHGKWVVNYVGPGNFFCSERTWYPTSPFGPPEQRASFHLHFSVDKKYAVVATGIRSREVVEGDQAVSDWSSPVPLTQAGFALGDYLTATVPASSGANATPAMDIFVNRQPDDVMMQVNNTALTSNDNKMVQSKGAGAGTAITNSGDNVAATSMGTLDPKQMDKQVGQDIGNTLRVMTAYFGPLPFPQIAATSVTGDFAHGWPMLLNVSDLSYLDTTQLTALGIHGLAMQLLTYSFRARDEAGQWFGNDVSWETPNDEWLAAGLASGASLVSESIEQGRDQELTDLNQWRRFLLDKDAFSRVPEQLGPLWLGNRLDSSIDPQGYWTVTYYKGGYVLLMLRSMMMGSGGAPKEDAAFIAMMRDFTSTYAQRDTSTADFKAVVEKHMTPNMDIDGNHTMDWFFNEYVYGTGVPTLNFSYAVTPAGGGKYTVAMKVDNPDNWKGPLPFYIYTDPKHFVRGQVRVHQAEEPGTLTLPFKPVKIVANAYQDMLVNVMQTDH